MVQACPNCTCLVVDVHLRVALRGPTRSLHSPDSSDDGMRERVRLAPAESPAGQRKSSPGIRCRVSPLAALPPRCGGFAPGAAPSLPGRKDRYRNLSLLLTKNSRRVHPSDLSPNDSYFVVQTRTCSQWKAVSADSRFRVHPPPRSENMGVCHSQPQENGAYLLNMLPEGDRDPCVVLLKDSDFDEAVSAPPMQHCCSHTPQRFCAARQTRPPMYLKATCLAPGTGCNIIVCRICVMPRGSCFPLGPWS
jgi:hypothetical protein